MNRDFAEMLAALSAAGADFMVIGAHAVAVYARPRATGDLDIWIRPTAENAERVWTALVAFGAPLHQVTRADLATDDLVFQIGVVPNRIDLRTSIGGVTSTTPGAGVPRWHSGVWRCRSSAETIS